jgi:hypothetical protein
LIELATLSGGRESATPGVSPVGETGVPEGMAAAFFSLAFFFGI